MRKYFLLVWVSFMSAALVCAIGYRLDRVHAQGPAPTYWEFSVPASSTTASCPVPAPNTPPATTFCFTGDGKMTCAVNNAASFSACPGSSGPVSGVTSFNGLTGTVLYTPPVISVNGKVGAVVLSAAASAPTVNLQ